LDKYLPKVSTKSEDVVKLQPVTVQQPLAQFNLPGMGGVFHPVNLAMYTYAHQNPVRFSDPDGRAAMAVYFQGYQVDTGKGFSLPLGHAGVVAIDNKSGATQYFEFGRYGGKYGDVRGPFDVGTVTFGKDGMPTEKSMDAIKATLSKSFGKDNIPNTIYNADADAGKVIEFALDRQKNVKDHPYTLNPFSENKLNFCDTFAKDALKAGTE